MNKNLWIVANWKSNKTIAEALEWVTQVGPQLPHQETLQVVLCPTISVLSEVKKAITVGGYPIRLGVQDLSPFGIGAYTGEEAAQLLKELVNFAILGHSERRKNFGETDEIIAKKLQQAQQAQMTGLVCLQGLETPIPQGCTLVAYEPVWAIGTGQPDTPENANQLAEQLQKLHGDDLAVLYGGSVTAANVKEFISKPNLSGVLIGNASLNEAEFIKICKIAVE